METSTYVVLSLLAVVIIALILKSKYKKQSYATYYESTSSNGLMGKLKDFGSSCCNKIKNAVGV